MRIRVGARTDVGRVREGNEDSYVVRDPLFAVADGMGGHRGGEVASAMALETVSEVKLPEAGSAPVLVDIVKQANRHVLERSEADRDLRGMGTTVTALAVEGGRAHLAHVGDSRAYRLRDGELQQLTHDHTLVQRMVDAGELTPQEAGVHPQRSILTRALGVEAEVLVDELTLDLQEGDRIMICSDGLTSMVGDDRIHQILRDETDPQAASDLLVDAANRAGGDDNITVIVLDFIEGEPEPDAAEARTVLAATPPASAEGSDGHPLRTEPATGVMTRPIPPPTEEREQGAPVPPSPASAPARRNRLRRLVVWLVVVGAVATSALIGTRVYLDHQWYVGDSGGRVAIFNGIPTKVLWFNLSHVTETTDISAAAAERLQPWKDLKQGHTVGSLEQARALVRQIRTDVEGGSGGSP
jgi:PPM family protein phosphatase